MLTPLGLIEVFKFTGTLYIPGMFKKGLILLPLKSTYPDLGLFPPKVSSSEQEICIHSKGVRVIINIFLFFP